jgi:hypothetical protein
MTMKSKVAALSFAVLTLAAGLAPVTAQASPMIQHAKRMHLPRHAPGASSAMTSPGRNNDGGGFQIKSSGIVRVPPMQPVRSGL